MTLDYNLLFTENVSQRCVWERILLLLLYHKKDFLLDMLSVSLSLFQLCQHVVRWANLATSRKEEWGKSDCNAYWPGGINVVNIIISYNLYKPEDISYMYSDDEETKVPIIAQPLVTQFFPTLPFFHSEASRRWKTGTHVKIICQFFFRWGNKRYGEKRMNE